ncbi:MAG: methyltransferase domain-containing protein [Pirellulales bacterium]
MGLEGKQLWHPGFPRANHYHPDWVTSSGSGGAHALWLTEWLSEAMDFQPGQRVLDLGCGRAASSIFLAREFGLQVWAADLWFSVADNWRRVQDAGVSDRVFPLHVDARALPFPPEFFDAIISIDSFFYYGTDDLYLSYLARLLRPGGRLGTAGVGLTEEFTELPEHLRGWWTNDLWCLHSADWWLRHWGRTGLVDVRLAESRPDGYQLWLDWQRVIAPENEPELSTVAEDAGRYLTYVRVVADRRPGVTIDEPITSVPGGDYERRPLLRPDAQAG